MDDAFVEPEQVTAPRWLRRPELVERTAAAVTVLSALIEILRVVPADANPLVLIGLAVALLGAACVRKYPLVGLSLAAIAPLLSGALGWQPFVEYAIAAFILFRYTLRCNAPFRGTIVVTVGSCAGVALGARQLLSFDVLTCAAIIVAAGALGTAFRAHQQYWISLERRTEQALATRESEAMRRVAEERLRIARDLHDVMGHQIAVLSMQLGVIEITAAHKSNPLEQALAEARRAIKAVLLETQRILGVLRTETEGAESTQASAGLRGLSDLVESFARLGLRVKVVTDVIPPALDAVVDVTIYRVIQEALTNAQRYGDGAAEIRIQSTDYLVEMSVVNNYSPVARLKQSVRGSGYGLLGMKERVTSAGGMLSITNNPAGTFIVHATLAVDGRILS